MLASSVIVFWCLRANVSSGPSVMDGVLLMTPLPHMAVAPQTVGFCWLGGVLVERDCKNRRAASNTVTALPT